MPQWNIDQIADKLSFRLAGSLPGLQAQLGMAPAHREELLREFAPTDGTREAAVLVAVTGHSRPAIVLTERRSNLKHHPGQISFPGGRREPEEDLQDTALREASEEIGLSSQYVQILGALTPLYIPPSRYHVYPFVGVVSHAASLAPSDDEVSQIILADVDQLCNPATRSTEVRTLRGQTVDIPFFDLDGHKIWGATAMMIAELVEALAD